jgi:hypothetical protein
MARSRRACPERSRRNPGDACWQMLFRAFQPQTTGQIKKVTSSDRSEPGFPATQHWTKPRVRLSLKERRMRSANATNVHRKSGVAKRRDLQFTSPSTTYKGTPLPSPLSLGEPVTFSISHPPQSRHPERSAARIYRITDGLWRAVEGPPAMLVGRCSSELSSHKLQAKSKKSQAPTGAKRSGGICSSLHHQPLLLSVDRRAVTSGFAKTLLNVSQETDKRSRVSDTKASF